MRKTLVVLIAGAWFTLAAVNACACSVMSTLAVTIDPARAVPGETAPPAPVVTVREIRRGLAQEPAYSCDDLGFLSLDIALDETNRDVLHRFAIIEGGTDELDLFDDSALIALSKTDGQAHFAFTWVDGADALQEPLDFIVRVTALTRSGKVGGHTDVRIADPGR